MGLRQMSRNRRFGLRIETLQRAWLFTWSGVRVLDRETLIAMSTLYYTTFEFAGDTVFRLLRAIRILLRKASVRGPCFSGIYVADHRK